MRILAAMDGKLIPFEGITRKNTENISGGLQLAQHFFGSTLYAPVSGILAEQKAYCFVLYADGGVRLRLSLLRLDGNAPAPFEAGFDPLVEIGAPLFAGQVLARLEYRALPAAELQLITHIEGAGSVRACHVPPLLEGGRTAVVQIYGAKRAVRL